MHQGDRGATGPVPDPAIGPSSARTARVVWVVIAILLVGVIVLVAYALTRPSATAQRSAKPARTSPGVLAAVTGVPGSVLDSTGVAAPRSPVIPPKLVTGAPLVGPGGKPLVLFVGADFCPFCAAERWPLVVALSRFGRFAELRNTASSPNAVFPSIQSFTFTDSSYTSRYVDFTGVELFSSVLARDGSYVRIAELTAGEAQVMARYGNGPTPGTAPGQLPFVDIANHMVASTAGFSPAVLVGLSQSTIAGDLSQAGGAVTPPVVASANYLTAGICLATGQQPGSVCASKGVRAADKALGLG